MSTSVLYTVGQGASCPYANNVSHGDNQERPPRSWMPLPPEKPRSRPGHSRGKRQPPTPETGGLAPRPHAAQKGPASICPRASRLGAGNTRRLTPPSLRGWGGSFLPLPAGRDGRCPSAPGRTPASASVLTRPIPSVSGSPRFLEAHWPLPRAQAENPGWPHLEILHVIASAKCLLLNRVTLARPGV